jgi:hypothetical protein
VRARSEVRARSVVGGAGCSGRGVVSGDGYDDDPGQEVPKYKPVAGYEVRVSGDEGRQARHRARHR